jgi:hypothetical protein
VNNITQMLRVPDGNFEEVVKTMDFSAAAAAGELVVPMHALPAPVA